MNVTPNTRPSSVLEKTTSIPFPASFRLKSFSVGALSSAALTQPLTLCLRRKVSSLLHLCDETVFSISSLDGIMRSIAAMAGEHTFPSRSSFLKDSSLAGDS